MDSNELESNDYSLEILYNYRKELETLGGDEAVRAQPELIHNIHEFLRVDGPYKNCGVAIQKPISKE